MAYAVGAGLAGAALLGNLAAKYTILYPHGTWYRLLASYIISKRVSTDRRDKLRSAAESDRVKSGKPHTLSVYFAVDDAHAYILIQALLDFVKRYAVELEFYVLEGGLGHSTGGAEQRAWQRRDAKLLGDLYGYNIPGDVGFVPGAEIVMLASRALLAARPQSKDFLASAIRVGDALFDNRERELASLANDVSQESAKAVLQENSARLKKAGHYLSGMVHYEGEWYWAVDRLAYLEDRLSKLPGSIREHGPRPPIFTKTYDLKFLSSDPPVVNGVPSHAIELFYSPRSPYSQLAVDRSISMAKFYGAELLIRPVYPMVMRKRAVPAVKAMYIVADMKRESDTWGFPFCRDGFKDPLWIPTYRFMAVWPYAEQQGKGKNFAQSFAHGVYCDGLDFGTNAGTKTIVERAGLDYPICLSYIDADEAAATKDSNGDDIRLHQEPWESNIQAMYDAGLWGVPSLRYGDTFVWGADRLWAIEAAILKDARLHITPPSSERRSNL